MMMIVLHFALHRVLLEELVDYTVATGWYSVVGWIVMGVVGGVEEYWVQKSVVAVVARHCGWILSSLHLDTLGSHCVSQHQ